MYDVRVWRLFDSKNTYISVKLQVCIIGKTRIKKKNIISDFYIRPIFWVSSSLDMSKKVLPTARQIKHFRNREQSDLVKKIVWV